MATLRRDLLDGVRVSDLCEEEGLQPTGFYGWQKGFFENGSAALERPRGRRNGKEQQYGQRIAANRPLPTLLGETHMKKSTLTFALRGGLVQTCFCSLPLVYA